MPHFLFTLQFSAFVLFLWMACCCACGWSALFNVPGKDPVTDLGFTATVFPVSTKTWYVSSDPRLTTDSGTGSLWKKSPPPSPSWAKSGMNMTAAVYQWRDNQQAGVFIGNGRRFYIDWSQNKYFRQSCDINGKGGADTPIALTGTPTNGDVLTLGIQGNGAGSTTYTIKYLINGVPIVGSEEDNVTLANLNPSAYVQGGVWSNAGAQFDGGPASPKQPIALNCGVLIVCPCANAPGTWKVTMAGWTGPCTVFNGTFEFAFSHSTAPPSPACYWLAEGVALTLIITALGGGSYNVQLFADSPAFATWSAFANTGPCNRSFTLSLPGGSIVSARSGFPPTVVVSPAP